MPSSEMITNPYDTRGAGARLLPLGVAGPRSVAAVLGSLAAVTVAGIVGAPGASADESGDVSLPDFSVPAGSTFATAAGADNGFAGSAGGDAGGFTLSTSTADGANPVHTTLPDLSDLGSWSTESIVAQSQTPNDSTPAPQVVPSPDVQFAPTESATSASDPTRVATPSSAISDSTSRPVPIPHAASSSKVAGYQPPPPIVGVGSLTSLRADDIKPNDVHLSPGWDLSKEFDPQYAQVPLLAGLDPNKVNGFLTTVHSGVTDDSQFRCVVESCLAALRDLSLSATTPSAEQLSALFPLATPEELRDARFTNSNGFTNVETGCFLVCRNGDVHVAGPLIVSQSNSVAGAGSMFSPMLERGDFDNCSHVEFIHTHPLQIYCGDHSPSAYSTAGLSEDDIDAMKWSDQELRRVGSGAQAGVSSACLLTGTTCYATLGQNGELVGEWRPGPGGLLTTEPLGGAPARFPTTVTGPHQDDPSLARLYKTMNDTMREPLVGFGRARSFVDDAVFRARLALSPQRAPLPSPEVAAVDSDGREREVAPPSAESSSGSAETGSGSSAGGVVFEPPPVDHELSKILGPNAGQLLPEVPVPSPVLTPPDQEGRYVPPSTPPEERVVLPAPSGFPGRDESLANVVGDGVFRTPVGTNDVEYRDGSARARGGSTDGGSLTTPEGLSAPVTIGADGKGRATVTSAGGATEGTPSPNLLQQGVQTATKLYRQADAAGRETLRTTIKSSRPLDDTVGFGVTRHQVEFADGGRGIYDADGNLLTVEQGDPPQHVPGWQLSGLGGDLPLVPGSNLAPGGSVIPRGGMIPAP